MVEDEDGFFSLSQDGWHIVGSQVRPMSARRTIARRGRRTTVGKLVTSETIAKRRSRRPPRTLDADEQARAEEKLRERTKDHQALVTRMAKLIGDHDGVFFEDEFSYDMLWVPHDTKSPAILFEMKTVTTDADAQVRVRHAVGQLSYYEYFHAAPRLPDRDILRCAVFDADVPPELCDYMSHEHVGALVLPSSGRAIALDSWGRKVLDMLPGMPAAPSRVRRTRA